ncbi:MAG: hypothetical protein EBZ49_11750 [Proteobacteria bacterium]|nr:hypothetical protein [Pseudomonadota bacterium]
MKELAVIFKALNLYARAAHHLAARTPFHSDHAFFAEVYGAADDAFDSIIERMIGLMGEESVGYPGILMEAASKVQKLPYAGVKENAMFYQVILDMEKQICAKASEIIQAGVTPGVEQLVGELCNQSEMRQYKIKQRIKK